MVRIRKLEEQSCCSFLSYPVKMDTNERSREPISICTTKLRICERVQCVKPRFARLSHPRRSAPCCIQQARLQVPRSPHYLTLGERLSTRWTRPRSRTPNPVVIMSCLRNDAMASAASADNDSSGTMLISELRLAKRRNVRST